MDFGRKEEVAQGLSEPGRAAAARQEGTAGGLSFVHALNEAAAELQQATISLEETYRTVGQQIARLGLRGAVGVLDEDGATLVIRAVGLPPHWQRALDGLERQSGTRAIGFRVALEGALLHVLRSGQACYLPDAGPVIAGMLPEWARGPEGPLLAAVAGEPGILAALATRERVSGALCVTGPGLTPNDLPLLQAFANHVAVALDNARLIAELRGSEERFRQLVERSPNAVLVCRRDQIVFANPAALRLLGAEREEQVIGRPPPAFVHPAHRAGAQARAEEALSAGAPLPPAEEQLVRLDGRVIDAEVTAIPLLYEGEPAVQKVIRDITELKRAERERAAAQRISAATHAAHRLSDLFKLIHNALMELMPAKNFFIALYDEDSRLLSYPYAVDEREEDWTTHTIGKGFTAYVIRTGRSLLAPPEVWRELIRAGEVEMVGAECVDWLGAPLQAAGRTYGALAVQTYSQDERLTEDDRRVLEYMSTHVAMAIERKRAEETLRRSEAILDAVGYAAAHFLRQADWQDKIGAVLERLGRAAEVSRVYLFENHPGPGGRLLTSQRCEWVAAGVEPQLDNPDLQALDYVAAGFERLMRELGAGRTVCGSVDSFPDSEQPLLKAQGILSLALVPVWAGGDWWGFMGLDDCERAREWIPAEIDALRAAADTLGAAIQRQRTEQTLQRQAAEFAALYDTARDLAAPKDLPDLLRTIVGRAMRLVGASAGDMYLFDAEREELEIIVSTDQAIPLGTRLKLGEGMAGRVAESRQPLVVDDYSAWEQRSEKYDGVSFRAVVQVPMLYGGALVGVLALHERGESKRRFDETAARRLALIAALAAGAVHNARLFETTRRHLEELEAASQISSALRAAHTLDQMIPALLDQTLAALHTEHGSIWLYEPAAGELKRAAARGWFAQIESDWVKPGEGIAGRVFATGEPYFVKDFANDALARPEARQHAPAGHRGACIPFRTSYDTIVGGMFVSVAGPRELTPDEQRLLFTVSEIAGNAIQRSRLHEQTERRLQRLTALHAIETAITASLDLNVTLNVLLDHVTAQLGVDAASVLLFNPPTQSLAFAAGRGFRSGPPPAARLRLGEGYAGRAALERRIVHVADLRSRRTDILRAPQYAAEGFVALYAVPLIAKGRVVGVLEIFRRSGLTPDAEWHEFLETLAQQAALAIDDAELFSNLQRSNLELSLAYDTTLEGWARALELRDAETEGHTRRVVSLAERLGRVMGLSEAELAHLRRGALLHDIGKVGIPDAILNKKGPLSEEEWAVMRRHPVYAYDLLAPIAYLRPALDIPYCHHERWDGSGYPRGLRAEQIPLAARVFAVVDAWDALRSDRPYRPAWTEAAALDYIREQAGKQFDPEVAASFLLMVAGEAGRSAGSQAGPSRVDE